MLNLYKFQFNRFLKNNKLIITLKNTIFFKSFNDFNLSFFSIIKMIIFNLQHLLINFFIFINIKYRYLLGYFILIFWLYNFSCIIFGYFLNDWLFIKDLSYILLYIPLFLIITIILYEIKGKDLFYFIIGYFLSYCFVFYFIVIKITRKFNYNFDYFIFKAIDIIIKESIFSTPISSIVVNFKNQYYILIKNFLNKINKIYFKSGFIKYQFCLKDYNLNYNSLKFYSYVTNSINYSLIYTYNIDVLSLFFILLNILLFLICLIFIKPIIINNYEKNVNIYVILLLFIFFLLNIVFTADNILIFFLAFESLLVPFVLLIGIWGSLNKRQANNYLIFYTSLGAIPIIISILYLWNQTGCFFSLNFSTLSLIKFSWTEQSWLWIAFFLSFAIKTPIVPFHIWLPKAHVDAPTVGSVLLAGLLLKIGLFGFLRLFFPVFPLATDFFSPYIASLATVGVLYSSLVTLRQIDIKRTIAYSSVSHINIALVSLCSLNPLGITASIYIILSHGIISSSLFLLIGFLYNRFHQKIIAYYGGLISLIPLFVFFFFLFSLANIAFPLTSGFISEFLCLAGIISSNIFLGILNAISILFTIIYSILLFGRICLGNNSVWLNILIKELKNKNNLPETRNVYFLFFKPYIKNISFNFFSNYYKNISCDLYYDELIIIIIITIITFYYGIYPYEILNLLNIYVNINILDNILL
jgi:proton-translocating NADH-quinone oxidoreductase chain M